MDMLAARGETSAQDILELQNLNKDELVDLVIGMNKGWNQLLERLEDVHKQDMKELEERLRVEFNLALNTTRENERVQLVELSGRLMSLGGILNVGIKETKSNGEILSGLKNMLGESMSEASVKQ